MQANTFILSNPLSQVMAPTSSGLEDGVGVIVVEDEGDIEDVEVAEAEAEGLEDAEADGVLVGV